MIKSMLGKQKFILVDSASHLTRTMALFQKQGLNPIPAPVGPTIGNNHSIHFFSCFPRASRLQGSEDAMHEYLGLAWAWLRGAV